VETQNTIQRFDFTNLLQPSAFFAEPEGKVHFWLNLKRQELSKTLDISVYCPSFFESQEWAFVYTSQQHFEFSRSEILAALEAYLKTSQKTTQATLEPLHFDEPQLSDYEKMFGSIMQKITSGEIEKAVPTLCQTLVKPWSFEQRLVALYRLLKYKTSAIAYGFWSADNQGYGYMGLTPEILFRLKKEGDQTRVSTMALAGTQALESSNDLLTDSKNLREHQLVVQDIEQVLKKNLSEAKVHLKGPYVKRLPRLEHLCTDIEVVTTENVNPIRLVKCLHPTPALGVSPRAFGVEWMRDLPGQEHRKKFGAPTLFRLSDTEFIALVNIRNIQWDDFKIWFETGGGLVKGSELNSEFKELALKRASTQSVLFGEES